jgi:3-hydroxyisobutyrate dehydrogenase
MELEPVSFVGVGRMGANMARRLREVGRPVVAVYDAHRPAAEALAAELGCAAPATLAEVVADANVVITVVSDDAAMERIFAQSGDSLLDGAQGRLFVNCATVTPAVHVEVERRAAAAGAQALEACMASSIPQARDGSLFLMCGGERAAFDRAQPVLEELAAEIRYVGRAGQAAQLKALVNMVMNINTAGLAEGLGLADALGLDLDMVREVFSKTGAASRVLQTDGADMQAREHDVYFSAEHAAKDSGIAVELAHAAGIDAPLAEATLRQYRRMVTMGLGELDKSGIAELTFRARASG